MGRFRPIDENLRRPILGIFLRAIGSAMNFVLQPWQLLLVILAAWVNRVFDLFYDRFTSLMACGQKTRTKKRINRAWHLGPTHSVDFSRSFSCAALTGSGTV
jgi:hypothetical protein